MHDIPPFANLARIESSVLCELLEEYGTGPWTAAYEHRWQRHSETWNAVHAALQAAANGQQPARPAVGRVAPPAWLPALARERIATLGRTWRQDGGFADVRLLERLGLLALEADDDYVLALVGGLGNRRGEASRAGQLRADPGLLERLWRVFEVEGGGEISLANIDKFSPPAASWQVTFRELVADGSLDRERVLGSCLQALQRDFGSYRAGWFSALYASLEPTPEEASRHQENYRALLRSQVTATVSLGALCLRKVSAAGALDDDALQALGPGLLARTKGAALDIVRVLDGIRLRRPDLRQALAGIAAAGLGHPHADVQRATVRLLTSLGAVSVAQDAAAELAPSVQRQLGKKPAAAPMPSAPHELPTAPPPLIACTGTDLLDRAAGLLEDASDPLELELVLAGLARLDQPAALKPLAKRARQVLQRGPREGVTTGWLCGHVARLLLVANGEANAPLPAPTARTGFLVGRLALVEAVLSGQRAPTTLLATPTTPGGYLEPGQLLRRIAASTGPPQTEDLAAALLRLATEGRAEALTVISGSDEAALVLRHALGGPRPGRPGILRGGIEVRSPALWVAASRARAPRDDDPVLLQAGLTKAGQGIPVRANLTAKARPFTWRDRRGEHQAQHWEFTINVQNAASAIDPQQPTLAIDSAEHSLPGADLEDWIGWLVATTPHDLEPALTDLIWPVLHGGHGYGVTHDATRALFALGRHPGPLGKLGQLALAAGMTADRADHRVLAVDAAVGFASTGRLIASDLAAAMSQLAASAQITRWAAALTSLAQAHPGIFVTDLLAILMPTLEADHRGVHALVEVLLEETIGQDGKITDPALRTWLGNLTGTGRGARAARQLLAL